jgi:hypothetical protein
LGRVGPGKVRATWNGRKSNGDIASSGKYRFRFVGTDVNGSVGKSGDRSVRVSDKKLVAKAVTRTVSAKGSFVGNGSGTCSGVYSLDYPQSRYGWPKGLGYYSRSKCVGNAQADVAVAVHRVGVPRAVRYGTISIDTYGGGAVQNAGPGVIVYVTSSGTAGASRGTSVGLAWHNGPAADADNYIKNGRVRWLFGTTSGNWFDVKEFRVTVRVFVLR